MHNQIRKEMQKAFHRVYDSHWYIQGQELKRYELKYVYLSQTKFSIGVSINQDALVLALRFLDTGPGV